jgi:hypothetical protein
MRSQERSRPRRPSNDSIVFYLFFIKDINIIKLSEFISSKRKLISKKLYTDRKFPRKPNLNEIKGAAFYLHTYKNIEGNNVDLQFKERSRRVKNYL